MRLVADLHIHSSHSIATSPKLTPPYLDRWARVKGIDLVGTGDCTHPRWLAELRKALEPEGNGFFRLRKELRRVFDAGPALAEGLPEPGVEGKGSGADGEVRFVISGEISTIYRREGRTRKVHHVVLLPDFAAAAAFQAKLERAGNISSDGRPILGLDSRDLFVILLEADERSILVPAHIWTPWFSALGARSGFDSIDGCYGDLAPRIGAIETGLSSNPPMNWAVSALDRFAIISNSDAHSPEKLGREATVLDMEASFAGLASALSGAGGGRRGRVAETVEFFPQEGKYHYDGHRACGVALSPEESAARGGICPVCGSSLTPGVMRRVTELADRPVDETAPCPADPAGTNRRPYRSLVPLPELLGELLGTRAGSKKVAAAYNTLVKRAGSEFSLLLDKPESEIGAIDCPGISGELLAEAIGRMRAGRVSIQAGFDGEYGVIRVFAPGESIGAGRGASLFADEAAPEGGAAEASDAAPEAVPEAAPAVEHRDEADGAAEPPAAPERAPRPFVLDPAQTAAVNHPGGPAVIVAGPGTGKTAVLAARIARLAERGLDPFSILALTFTNKAAGELRSRIAASIGRDQASAITASTFHSFCLSILREQGPEAGLPADFRVLDEDERASFLGLAAAGASRPAARGLRRLGEYIETRKRFLLLPGDRELRLGPFAPAGLAALAAEFGLLPPEEEAEAIYAKYREALRQARALDFDDLVAVTARLLSTRCPARDSFAARYRALFVDEYQDINFAQYALMRVLAPGGRAASSSPAGPAELCVIGDPNQAIYGFRGSDRRFMDRFLVDYPDAAVYRLTKSFRCAPAIIGAAGRLVDAELEGSDGSVALSRAEYPTDKSEAEGIAREIDRLIGGTRFFALDSGVVSDRSRKGAAGSEESGAPQLSSLGECAVLVRASALAPPLVKALLDHGIPYLLIGEKPWWEEEPALSVLKILRTGAGPGPPAEAIRTAAEALAGAGGSRDGAAGSRTESRAATADAVERLAALAADFPNLHSFLDALALGAPQDGLVRGPEVDTERVSVMTIHAAKGLEFDQVFVAGLEDGILPFTLFDGGGKNERETEDAGAAGAMPPDAAEKGDGIEEERRLLYVAMTRARVGLHLSWARSRLFRGRRLALPPSRFLATIEDLVPMAEAAPRRPMDKQLGLF